MKTYGVVRCSECNKDLEGEIQVYDSGKCFCENCNLKIGHDIQVSDTSKKLS